MAAIQRFWQENLPKVIREVQSEQEEVRTNLKEKCMTFAKTLGQRNLQVSYNECHKGFNDQNAQFMLSLEYQQRKVFECMKEMQKQSISPNEFSNYCLPGVKDKLYEYVNIYKQNISHLK